MVLLNGFTPSFFTSSYVNPLQVGLLTGLSPRQAAWAAQQQGKFWEYYSALFEGQKQLGEELYGSIAQKLNLKLDKFNTDRNSPAAEAAIQKDVQLAQSLGIRGTPFFIMNDQIFSGAIELAEMEKILASVSK